MDSHRRGEEFEGWHFGLNGPGQPVALKARLLRLRESSSEGRRVDALDSCMEIVDAHLVTILTFLLRAHKQLRVNALKPVVGHFRTL